MIDKDKQEKKLQKILSSVILFIECCCKIKNKDKKFVPFILNKQQKALLNIMEKHRFTIICKNRQIGISSVVAAKAIYMCLTQAGTSCLLMSYKGQSVTTLWRKLREIYDSIPKFILKRYSFDLIIDNKEEMKFANSSSIVCCVCSTHDVAQGATLDYVHISEVALCRDSLLDQLAAIQGSLTPSGVMCLESTPQGGQTQFAELYKNAEANKNLFKPIFFSWLDDTDESGMHYKEQKQYAQIYINRHGKLPELKDLDEKEKDLYYRGCSYELLAWRRIAIEQLHGEQKFNENFPVDAETAFMTSNTDNMFNIDRIHERLNAIRDIEPIEMPTDLPEELESWYGRGLDIWSTPKLGEEYYCGLDSSEGIGKTSDYSVIEIIDTEGNQVAELRTNKTKPFDFAKLAYHLGKYFNYGQLVVERASSGISILEKLTKDYEYMNVYRSKQQDVKGSKRRDGFSTNSQTKPKIIRGMVEWFDTDLLTVNSKILLNEMLAFAYKNGKMEAATGKDDCVMAMSMAIQACKEGRYYV